MPCMPLCWADNLYLNLRVEEGAREQTHHQFLVSLNMNPSTLALVQVSEHKSPQSIYLTHQRRGSRSDWETIWNTLDVNFERTPLNQFIPIQRETLNDLYNCCQAMTSAFGLRREPYRYLSHRTSRGIEFGSDAFQEPSDAALAALPPSRQKPLLGHILFELIFNRAPRFAALITDKLLFMDNTILLESIRDPSQLDNHITTLTDVILKGDDALVTG